VKVSNPTLKQLNESRQTVCFVRDKTQNTTPIQETVFSVLEYSITVTGKNEPNLR
jgi:hypothetical protein